MQYYDYARVDTVWDFYAAAGCWRHAATRPTVVVVVRNRMLVLVSFHTEV